MSDIAIRDDIISQLNKKIEFRKKHIRENLLNIVEMSKTNEFLVDVADDYHKYNCHIKKQKQDQEKHLRTIIDYLDRLISEEKLTHASLEHAKMEQQRALQDIFYLKNEIDEIITDKISL
jgi:hypothetical protein